MDLNNEQVKLCRQHANKASRLRTSLSHDLSSLRMLPLDSNAELTSNQHRRASIHSHSSQSTASQNSSYQTISAACREHGIHIKIKSNTDVPKDRWQLSSSTNSTDKKSMIEACQERTFIDRKSSRSSSAIQSISTIRDQNQDSRPFSAQSQAIADEFDDKHDFDNSSVSIDDLSESSVQHSRNQSRASTLTREHTESNTPINHSHCPITNNHRSQTENDPDFIYMSALLRTNDGDSLRGNDKTRLFE
jgi:hypothetical protein